MVEVAYDRAAAVNYAETWALKRNPAYMDFEHSGGDCTNFASQCIYAGSKELNFTPLYGWFYLTASNRTPSWTGVEFLRNFLIGNKALGPYAQELPEEEAQPGDIVQLGNAQRFYHSPVVVKVENGEIFIAAHSVDVWMRPLSDYSYQRSRCLHILGVRKP
ncbi:MAG: amidase domain-containing protein [Christensenellaceae bacterium]|jgi:hypothetical protein|nr:amidase domain-containing protein [Christensenellaceae bacterium]